MSVRVHLRTGEVVEGEAEEVQPERLVVGKPGNRGYETRTIAHHEIARIEVPRAGVMTSTFLWVAFALAVVIAALGISLDNAEPIALD
jgi:hypothetical protein